MATARVLRDGTGITGAVIAEWDDDLGRAWIVGPWVVGEGDPWIAPAGELLDAALAQLLPNVTRCEMCGDSANRWLADLAATVGWMATEPNHVLVADAGVAGWPATGGGRRASLRTADPRDIGAIAALHDVEFPTPTPPPPSSSTASSTALAWCWSPSTSTVAWSATSPGQSTTTAKGSSTTSSSTPPLAAPASAGSSS